MTPQVSERKNRGGGCDGAAAAKLTDDGFTGDEEGTSVTASTSRMDWCPNRALYRPLSTPATELGGSAMVHGGARPRSGLTGPVELATSSHEQR